MATDFESTTARIGLKRTFDQLSGMGLRWVAISASSGEKMCRSTFSSSPVPVLVGNRCGSVSKVRPVFDKCRWS